MAITNEDVVAQIAEIVKNQAKENAKLLKQVDERIAAAVESAVGASVSAELSEEARGRVEAKRMMKEVLQEMGLSGAANQPLSALAQNAQTDVIAKMAELMKETEERMEAKIDSVGTQLRVPSTLKSLYNEAWDFAEKHPWFTVGMLLLAATGAVVAGYSVYNWASNRVNVSVDLVGDDQAARLRAM